MSTDNIDNSFLDFGQYIAVSKKAKPEVIENLSGNAYNQVYADLTTTFTILIGIFFPSVTGKSLLLVTINLLAFANEKWLLTFSNYRVRHFSQKFTKIYLCL